MNGSFLKKKKKKVHPDDLSPTERQLLNIQVFYEPADKPFNRLKSIVVGVFALEIGK